MRALLLSTLLLVAASFQCFAQSDWYIDAGSSCAGHGPLREAISTFVPPVLPVVPITPGSNFAYRVPVSKFNEIAAAQPLELSSKTLTAEEAQSVRKILLDTGPNKVPMIIKIGVAILSELTITQAVTSLTAGFLFDQVYSTAEAASVAQEQVALFVAEGGRVVRRATIGSRDAERYIVSTITYEVSVGNERRSFVLSSCIAPISLAVTQLTTRGGPNQKIIKPNDGAWGVWDVEESKWDSTRLIFVAEGPDYYEFYQDEIEMDAVVGRTVVRIGTRGGPWEKKGSDSQVFRKLYMNVDAQ